MSAWPEYAPLLADSYQEVPDWGVLRSDTDSGIAKQRPRYSQPIVTRNVRFYVESDADKLAFDAWFDAMSGAGWFDLTVPRSTRIVQARIVGGKMQWDAPQGPLWTGSCSIETVGR